MLLYLLDIHIYFFVATPKYENTLNSKDLFMKEVSVSLDVASAHCPQVDQNKRFLKMVRINITFDDGGG